MQNFDRFCGAIFLESARMKKIWVLALISAITMAQASGFRHGERTRHSRQNNHYNYRPQSLVIDDEIEYRSYDNNFAPLSESPSGSYRYRPTNSRAYSAQPPFQNPSWGPQPPEDDYPQDLDLPDDEEVETEPSSYQPPQPAPRTNFNYRPQLGPRPSPPPSPRRFWDDQSGRERGDASYSFGYDLHDQQSRHENSDIYGNVNGDFSFIDDEGTFRKISYSAGANKGFEVLHKTPSDGPSSYPSSPKRVPVRKPLPVIHSEPPRLPPIRIPNPGHNSGHPRHPVRSPTQGDISSGAGIGISIPVPNGSGDRGDRGSGGPPPRDSRDRVKHGGHRHRPSSHNNPDNNGERDPPVNMPENPPPPPTHPPSPNPEGAENAGEDGPKSWGALGGFNNAQGGRRMQMRRRKPSLVVKVKRPAGPNQNQTPAWMYYRPPNPGRPQPGGGWVGKKPPSPTPAPFPEDPDDPDRWSEDNEVDAYPKDKSYSFGYNTGDQTRQEVSDAFGNIRGSYSYVDPQGIHRTVHYTAGNAGFKVLNAQPSFLRPVYTEAPSVRSIPIPIPVMSQLSHYQIPQSSTIVYHIHPDGITADGSEWKPWEPRRTVSKPTIYQRHTRHRKPRMRSSSSAYAQNNLFQLTHENRRFFPTFSNILEPEPVSTDVGLNNEDAESVSVVEENPLFLKQIQQQQRRSHKLKKLQREYQSQPVFQYARAKTQYIQTPRYPNRLSYDSESTDEIAQEDQQFSDYETTTPSPRSHRRHRHRSSKERLKKNGGGAKNSTDTDFTTMAAPTEAPSTPMAVEGDTDIKTYQGGYGDKNPLLVISATGSSSSSSSSDDSSNKPRQQRKIFSSSEKRASAESTPVPDSLFAESMVMASIMMPSTTEAPPKSKEKDRYFSPAALLSAKMASAPTPKAASISAISLPLSMSSDAAIPFDMNVPMSASSMASMEAEA